tara:strand:- start:141 stop:389 length:249 start_codon:yes stop_codon:yes gene_type:complete
MKRFNKFTEDIDKVAALKARQKAAVSKFKSSSESPQVKKPESRVHSGDVASANLAAAKAAKAKAMARKAEIRAEIQKEKQDK